MTMPMPGVNKNPRNHGDDIAELFGTGGPASILWETADANAHALVIALPNGGDPDVPVLIIGDQSVLNVDLAAFNGQTEPRVAIYNAAGDAYIAIDAGDDAVAQSKGIYFKSAADEDIELLNLSPTGTPRVFWDESENLFGLSHALAINAAGVVIGQATHPGSGSTLFVQGSVQVRGAGGIVTNLASSGAIEFGNGGVHISSWGADGSTLGTFRIGMQTTTGGGGLKLLYASADFAFQENTDIRSTGTLRMSGGAQIGAASTDNMLDDASTGGASATLYIGNAAISMVSDMRVKENIRLWEGDALELIAGIRVVEFDYLAKYRPYAGVYSDKYVGMTAQEIFQLAPWAVNTQGGKDCPKCLMGEECLEHNPWQVNHELLTGVLVKAIQELKQEVETLRR